MNLILTLGLLFSLLNVYEQQLIRSLYQRQMRLLQACKLANQFGSADVAIGFPRIFNRVRSIGVLNVTVLFVDFVDSPAVLTPQQVFQIISPGSENFFYVSSYGKLTLRLMPHLRWIRMSKRSTEYNMSPSISFDAQKAYITEAANLAVGVDFSASEEILVMTNPSTRSVPYGPTFTPPRGWGITIRNKTFENAVNSGFDLTHWGSYWLNHELSHSMGLPDLYAYTGSGPLLGFTGEWSIMGNIGSASKEYFGWERWLLNWISDSQVACVTKNGATSATLSPIEIAGGLGSKIVVVPVTNTTAVVVESRRRLGFDKPVKPGVLAYLVDTGVRSGQGPIKVLPLNSQDSLKHNATLTVGESITYKNVKIYFTYSNSLNDQIYVIKSN